MNHITPRAASWREEDGQAEPTSYIAIDANPYFVRLTHTVEGVILDTLEAEPQQISRVLGFIRRRRRAWKDVVLTGARSDRGPPGLYAAVVAEFGPISWAPQFILNKTASGFRKCTQLLKFFRCTFLAACAAAGEKPRIDEMLEGWKKAVLADMGFNLGPPPNIPF
jgi:hypothetical protein